MKCKNNTARSCISVPQMIFRHADVTDERVEACSGYCWLCGSPMSEGVPRQVAIKSTFTDHEKASSPNSTHLCISCAFSLCEAFPVTGYEKPQRLRTHSHFVTVREWEVLSKKQKARMRDILLNPPEEHWAFVIAVSGQKHLLFRTPVNSSREQYSVQFEEVHVRVARTLLARDLEMCDALYTGGLRKEDLVLGRWNRYVSPTPQLLTMFRHLQTLRGSPYLSLLVFLARKEEDSETGSDDSVYCGESHRGFARGDPPRMAGGTISVEHVGDDRSPYHHVCPEHAHAGRVVEQASKAVESESISVGSQLNLFGDTAD